MDEARSTVLIDGPEVDEYIQLLIPLVHSCGLDICRQGEANSSRIAGRIVLGTDTPGIGAATAPSCSTIQVTLCNETLCSSEVRFLHGASCPALFKGRSLVTNSPIPGEVAALTGEVVAMANGVAIWTSTSDGGLRHDRCYVSRPWLKAGDCLFQHLNREHFLDVLPLLEWLRWISDWRSWQQPALRACFMFDDPNLHSKSYGFIGFERLSIEARRHKYHTSFATVPLDSYYVNGGAAQTFRENRDTLSLLIHGNNHTKRELAQPQPFEQQVASMRQALHRVSLIERKAGLVVSKVMAPPHGLCSAGMMRAMVNAGFEAACVSHGSVWTANPGAGWMVPFGLLPASFVHGLPVIPRFGLEHAPETNVLLAAYLNQPIILVGHHWDLAHGLEILSKAARMINGLGRVVWTEMSEIVKTNCRVKANGSLMRIEIFSRRVEVVVPENIMELQVEAPWTEGEDEKIECRTLENDRKELIQPLLKHCCRFSIGARRRRVVEIIMTRRAEDGHRSVSFPTTPIRAVARRVMVELRDRSMPYLPRTFVKN